MYDLIIIGGGPGGYTAAARAGEADLSVLLIEKRALGGVCLNEGCIPSKTLLHSAKVFDYAKHADSFGVSVKGAEIDHSAVIERKNKVVGTLVAGVKALMKKNKVTVINGEAVIKDKNTVTVKGEDYSANYLIIATGSEPAVPPVKGLAEGLKSGRVLTSREVLDLDNVPQRLTVIGGGAVGLEMACYYNAAGSKVTVIEMLPAIGGSIDGEISQMLMKTLEKKGIDFLCQTRVTALYDSKVEFERQDGTGGIIEADKVLLSAGRKPVIEGFGLETTGVIMRRGAICADMYCRTNIPNIYAIGDVNGMCMLAHAAYRQADVAVNHILGKYDDKHRFAGINYDAVPAVIYTSPEVACVGDTQQSAQSKGIECRAVSVPVAYSGRFVAENDSRDGICKVVIGKKHRDIIGVHLLGSYASEIIAVACAMIEQHMRVDDVKEITFPHPTVAEIIREAVFLFGKEN